MRLSTQLMEAARQKVLLAPGYIVTVRTRTRGSKPGERVAEGRITEIDPATHTVRVVDEASGSTLEIDVDTERYDLWVKPPDSPVSRDPKAISLFLRPSMQGIYTGGRID